MLTETYLKLFVYKRQYVLAVAATRAIRNFMQMTVEVPCGSSTVVVPQPMSHASPRLMLGLGLLCHKVCCNCCNCRFCLPHSYYRFFLFSFDFDFVYFGVVVASLQPVKGYIRTHIGMRNDTQRWYVAGTCDYPCLCWSTTLGIGWLDPCHISCLGL